MSEAEPILPFESKIFFVVFFCLILLSIGHAFYRVEILKNFHVYSESDEIIRASDFYWEVIDKAF